MDFLLISPPVANVGQATAALSVLTAFARARGWDAHQWDLSIDAFHHFHSARRLRECEQVVIDKGADGELRAVAKRVVAEIDAAKEALRSAGVETDRGRMRWAFDTLRDAGVLLTAASLGRFEHDFRHFAVPNALKSFDHLDRVLSDRDCNPYIELFEDDALPRLARERPRAVGITITYLSQLIPGLTLARLIRRRMPDVAIVLGGAYLTAIGQEAAATPPSIASADALVLHDGEEALDAWLEAVVAGRGEPSDTPNLYLPTGEAYRRCGRGPVAETDLATLPVPMWIADGLELERYLVPYYPIGLPLSRGCYWGRCVYCNISSQTAGSYRCRPVAEAIADIKAAMAETRSSSFDFSVDSFRPKDLQQLAKAIMTEGLEIDWAAEVLFDPGFTADVVADLARSGCRCLRFGLESACGDTLEAMNKFTRPEVAGRILAACKEHGIRTAVMLIAGFPSETRAALYQTFDYLVDNRERIDLLTIHPYSLVTGSTMARDPGRFGIYLPPQDAVLVSGLPYVNTNPGGTPSEDVATTVEAMRERLREHYPDLGQLWAAAIGGWMTFAACCSGREESG